MIGCATALLVLAGGLLQAAQDYDPFAHPALVLRQVTAYTAPIRLLDLAAEEAGRIAAVLLQPGDCVPAGEPVVVRLDAELARLEVAVAEARLASRRCEATWHAQDRQHAERDAERAEALFAQGRLAEQARDAALRERDRARGIAAMDDGLIAVAIADLAAANERCVRRELHAPGGWVVIERLREPGAMVAAGEPILRLADVSELVVSLRLDEAELAALRGQAAAKTLALRFAGCTEPVPAHIRRVDVTYDPTSRKRLVELVVAGDAAPEASGGLAAELEMTVPDPTGGVLVPLTLVEWRLERPMVRTTDGKEFAVIPLRRTPEALVVAPTGLPPGAKLVSAKP